MVVVVLVLAVVFSGGVSFSPSLVAVFCAGFNVAVFAVVPCSD